MGERGDEETVPRLTPHSALSWSHRPRRLGPRGTFSRSHPGTRRRYPWSYPGTTPPVLWDHTGRFRGTNRGARTKPVVPAWSLVSHGKSGLWDHRGPSPLSWGRDHGWSWDHSTVGPRMVPAPRRGGPAPRAATGHRVGGTWLRSQPIAEREGDEVARRRPARRVREEHRRQQRPHDRAPP